jgi:CBS domain-containing protein
MPTIDTIMTREVATLQPEMSLREAVEVLEGAGASGAPVLAGEKIVGVASRTDILEFQGSHPGVPTRRDQQGEWGSADVWDQDAEEAPSAYFAEWWDDAGADVYERLADPESPEWDILEEHTVGEIMTRRIVALPPDSDVREASRLMSERRIHRVLVVRDERLEGIVTTMDVVRAVAEGRL